MKARSEMEPKLGEDGSAITGYGLRVFSHKHAGEIRVQFGDGLACSFRSAPLRGRLRDDLIIKTFYGTPHPAAAHIGPTQSCRRDSARPLLAGCREVESEKFLRVADRAVFACSTGGDLLKAQHIEQRNLNRDGTPHLGMLRDLDAHQQTAIRAADNAQTPGLRRNQIVADCREVVIDALPMDLQSGLEAGPNSPPPRMLARTNTPPRSTKFRRWASDAGVWES